MSLTEDISLLISRANVLISTFEGKKAGIDNAVAAAIATAAEANKAVFVDPVNGNDANIGSVASPVMTVDRALEMLSSVAVAHLRLLGDATITRLHRFFGRVLDIRGVRYDPALPSPVVFQQRNLSFVGEAPLNSDQVRAVPGIYFSGSVLELSFINLTLPNIDPAIVSKNHFTFVHGGALHLRNCGVAVSNAATQAVLAVTSSPSRLTLAMTGTTIAADAKGKILGGVAANADPNAQWNYVSNVNSL